MLDTHRKVKLRALRVVTLRLPGPTMGLPEMRGRGATRYDATGCSLLADKELAALFEASSLIHVGRNGLRRPIEKTGAPARRLLMPWSMASPNCTKDAFMQPASSLSPRSSDLAKILQNGIDEVCVNVFFAQRGADRELDARNYVRLRFVRLPRNGGFFFDLHVAPHAAVYRNVQNPSNGVDHPVGVTGVFN